MLEILNKIKTFNFRLSFAITKVGRNYLVARHFFFSLFIKFTREKTTRNLIYIRNIPPIEDSTRSYRVYSQIFLKETLLIIKYKHLIIFNYIINNVIDKIL